MWQRLSPITRPQSLLNVLKTTGNKDKIQIDRLIAKLWLNQWKAEVVITWRDDNHSAKKANLCIRQPEMVHPLGQLKDRVHEELCVSRRHGIDGVLPYDVSIKTNQALQQIRTHVTLVAHSSCLSQVAKFQCLAKLELLALNYRKLKLSNIKLHCFVIKNTIFLTDLSSSPFHCYECVVRKSKALYAMNIDFKFPTKNQQSSKNKTNRLKPNI